MIRPKGPHFRLLPKLLRAFHVPPLPKRGPALNDVQEFLNAIKAKKNDGNDGVSTTIRRSPANCSARIRRCRKIDAVWRSGPGLFELRLYGRTYRTMGLLSQQGQ